MIHPDTTLKYINDQIGYGVVATRFIPAGTIIWVRDPLDQIIDPALWHSLPELVRSTAEIHAFRFPNGEYVLCWDIARYINHSFNPNTSPTPLGFDVALRAINSGEELRGDYGMLCIEEPFSPIPEPEITRSIVYPNDAPILCNHYDSLLAPLWPLIPLIPQPLAKLLAYPVWEKLLAFSAQRESPPSLSKIYRITEI